MAFHENDLYLLKIIKTYDIFMKNNQNYDIAEDRLNRLAK
jgi:hypothetical protein